MDPAQLAKVVQLIKRYNSGIIALQNNPSVDGIAAGTALYLALSKINKHVSLACHTFQKIDLLGVDRIQNTLTASGNHLVVSFPYVEGSIAKVDYSITGDTFNLIIEPTGEINKVNPKDVKFSYTGGKIEFIITVDVPNLNSLGPLYTENQNQFQAANIVNIDRHLINNNFGTINLVNKQISSTSELVYAVIRELGVELDKDIATNLYTGILAATNNFSSYSVNPQTFEVAATLMKHGAIKKQIPAAGRPGFGAPNQPSAFPSFGAPMGAPPVTAPRMSGGFGSEVNTSGMNAGFGSGTSPFRKSPSSSGGSAFGINPPAAGGIGAPMSPPTTNAPGIGGGFAPSSSSGSPPQPPPPYDPSEDFDPFGDEDDFDVGEPADYPQRQGQAEASSQFAQFPRASGFGQAPRQQDQLASTPPRSGGRYDQNPSQPRSPFTQSSRQSPFQGQQQYSPFESSQPFTQPPQSVQDQEEGQGPYRSQPSAPSRDQFQQHNQGYGQNDQHSDQGQNQEKSPQDWLKPKLFRGDNIL